MKSGTHLRTGAVVLFALLAIAIQPSAWGQTFTTFDPPDSLSTAPSSINSAGQIAGTYFDSNFATHGFVRASDGAITSFDAPGFILSALLTAQGSIMGIYQDANYHFHIFLRAKDGTITTLDVPSPAASIYEAVANSAGAIAGGFSDANGTPAGFIRAPGGKFTFFEFPPALRTCPFSPSILAMTPGGAILGSYCDSNFVRHGFLRTADGTFTTSDPPNSVGTTPTSINDSGMITGFFNDGSQNGNLRAFLRASDGTFSAFDAPQLGVFGAGASVNSSGAVAGSVLNEICGGSIFCTQVPISFLRAPNGSVKQVNDPKGVQGTQVNGNNAAGELYGVYFDANGTQHGFVAKP